MFERRSADYVLTVLIGRNPQQLIMRGGAVRRRNAQPLVVWIEFSGHNTPGRIRTCDLRFRKPLLYPLSYEG